MSSKKNKMFCVRVDDELVTKFKSACKKTGKKASEMIREYMELVALKYGI
jgi:hypothetical protein